MSSIYGVGARAGNRKRIDDATVFQRRADGWTLQRLADSYGVTRAAVSAYLKRAATRTRVNRLGNVSVRPCACGCGGIARGQYASRACYFNHRCRRVPSVLWRHGQRLARAKVAEVFPLQPQHVVHHDDKDDRNNTLRNLHVFATSGDHLRYHRGMDVSPIWCGL